MIYIGQRADLSEDNPRGMVLGLEMGSWLEWHFLDFWRGAAGNESPHTTDPARFGGRLILDMAEDSKEGRVSS